MAVAAPSPAQRAFVVLAIAGMLVAVASATLVPSALAKTKKTVTTPVAGAAMAPEPYIRPKPPARPFKNPASVPPTPTPKRLPSDVPRLEDPVLRWLPEMVAAYQATGVPVTLIAGIMRTESGGEPSAVSPVGAQGLMQVMPWQLASFGVPEEAWLDPATNILTGARLLAVESATYGGWEGAVAAYFGFGCDVLTTCTDQYVAVVFSWMAYYAPTIAGLGLP